MIRFGFNIFDELRFDKEEEVEFKLVFVDEHLSLSIGFVINVCVERK
jgi:hypothetical protein